MLLTNAQFRALREGDRVRVVGPDVSLVLATHLVQLVVDEQDNTVRANPCVTPNYWEFADDDGVARVGFIPAGGDDNDPVEDRAHGDFVYTLEQL